MSVYIHTSIVHRWTLLNRFASQQRVLSSNFFSFGKSFLSSLDFCILHFQSRYAKSFLFGKVVVRCVFLNWFRWRHVSEELTFVEFGLWQLREWQQSPKERKHCLCSFRRLWETNKWETLRIQESIFVFCGSKLWLTRRTEFAIFFRLCSLFFLICWFRFATRVVFFGPENFSDQKCESFFRVLFRLDFSRREKLRVAVGFMTIATWLILPVIICLSQR